MRSLKSTSFKRALPALLAAVAVVHFNAAPNEASACAILPIDAGSGPRLSTERVALLYDDEQKIEHFVREVRFDGASSAFAFVVPTPAKPELKAIEEQPFDELERTFPLVPPPQEPGLFEGGAKAAAPPPKGVEVLSVQQVGKFTAFILAANDAAALDQWLKDNRITLPAGGRPWLDHYVALKFFFSAFRYEAPEGAPSGSQVAPPSPTFAEPPTTPDAQPSDSAEPSPDKASVSLKSETVRLSFRTDVPFYPYLEPAHISAGSDPPRTMEVWLISRRAREPRLRRMTRDQPARWAFPWQAQLTYEKDWAEVARPLGEVGALLAKDGSYHVQTFHDGRTNRDGWGDILFPEAGSPTDEPAWRSTAISMLGDLDKGLTAGELEPFELENEASFRVTPGPHGCACDVEGRANQREAGLAAGLALVAVGAAVKRRKRRP